MTQDRHPDLSRLWRPKNRFLIMVLLLFEISECTFTDMLNGKVFTLCLRAVTLTSPFPELSILCRFEKIGLDLLFLYCIEQLNET